MIRDDIEALRRFIDTAAIGDDSVHHPIGDWRDARDDTVADVIRRVIAERERADAAMRAVVDFIDAQRGSFDHCPDCCRYLNDDDDFPPAHYDGCRFGDLRAVLLPERESERICGTCAHWNGPEETLTGWEAGLCRQDEDKVILRDCCEDPCGEWLAREVDDE